jgi:hypothetical protein
MEKESIVKKLLTAQQSLAEVRELIPDEKDNAKISAMLHDIPGIIGRIESGM